MDGFSKKFDAEKTSKVPYQHCITWSNQAGIILRKAKKDNHGIKPYTEE